MVKCIVASIIFLICCLYIGILVCEKRSGELIALYSANMQQNTPQSYEFCCWGMSCVWPIRFHCSTCGKGVWLFNFFHESKRNLIKAHKYLSPFLPRESKYFIVFISKLITTVAQCSLPRLIGKIIIFLQNMSLSTHFVILWKLYPTLPFKSCVIKKLLWTVHVDCMSFLILRDEKKNL